MNIYEITSETDSSIVFYAEDHEAARAYLITRLETSAFDTGSIEWGPAEKIRSNWEHWGFWLTGTIDGEPVEQLITYAVAEDPATEPENPSEGDLITKYEQARAALDCTCCGEYGVVYGQCEYLESEGPVIYPAFIEARNALADYRAQFKPSTPIPYGPEDLYKEEVR